MSFLRVQPVWATRELSDEEIEITNKLDLILQRLTTSRASVERQVREVERKTTKEGIATFTGNVIDDLFKQRVRSAIAAKEIPQSLQLTPRGMRGPDAWLDRVAWDVTTAEAGRQHVTRDVLWEPSKWDAYFVLGY